MGSVFPPRKSPRAACQRLSAAMAAVSVRRMRGPSDTGTLYGRDVRRVLSFAEKPPSGPTNMAHEASGAARRASRAGAPPASSQNMSRRDGGHLSKTASSGAGGRTVGTSIRPHCSAASTAWARKRSRLIRLLWLCCVETGQISDTPNSHAFSINIAERAGLIGVNISTGPVAAFCVRV